ncbi:MULTISPECIES: hypothetical protein [unclassified Methylobacterium]|uniref:hypothetical protein n=1 Tax=unclassified Methylobacterium TaxID=2615210 RepID=UPI00226AD9D3|nr:MULTISPECIES: hypothetical protein [unclassified Methylobacterium]
MNDDEELPDYANMTGEEILAFVPPGWDKPIGQMTREDLMELSRHHQERAEAYAQRADTLDAMLAKMDNPDS